MAQVLDTRYVDIVTRNFAQVSRDLRGVSDQLKAANVGAQLMSRSLPAVGAALAAVGGAAAGVAAGVALVKHGFADTSELFRFQFALQQVSREAAGLFVPVMNQAARSAWALFDTFRNSPHLQDALTVGLVTPMVLFVKGLEVAVRLGVVLADTMARVAGAVLRLNGVNVGNMGFFGRLTDAVRQANKQVTLNQTGTETGQQTFQRIQEAILKMGQPDEKDPVAEILKEIDGKVGKLAKVIEAFGNAAEVDPVGLAQRHMRDLDDQVPLPLGKGAKALFRFLNR